jgi:hypothetical protein
MALADRRVRLRQATPPQFSPNDAFAFWCVLRKLFHRFEKFVIRLGSPNRFRVCHGSASDPFGINALALSREPGVYVASIGPSFERGSSAAAP